MKYINFKRYKFSTLAKKINIIRYDFLRTLRFIDFRRYNFKKIYKYFDFKRYNFYQLVKKIKLKEYKYKSIYFATLLIFISFVYLSIPIFYDYNKSDIEKIICENQKIECLIKGKISYSFYPTPRIKIKDLIIKDFFKKKETFATIKDVSLKLSITNLLDKKNPYLKKVELNNFVINFKVENLAKYKNIFQKMNNFTPLIFSKGKIRFFDNKKNVATINDVNLNLKSKKNFNKAIIKGNFLNNKVYINLNNKNEDVNDSFNLILKIPELNIQAKINSYQSKKDKNTTSGNFSIKQRKKIITAFFDYRNQELIINKSNLRNTFLDGKLAGKIIFLPYFDFNLDLELSSLNFTKLYNSFLSLDEKSKKSLFQINNKINGKLNLSSDKIYTKHNLVKSFESRIKFYNGNISIEQFLLNLGKLGAADILGAINKNEKFTNFKFESNIFIDNQKKFLSKFGIFNKKSMPSNLFISGNFDLNNTKISFYEISGDKKFNNEDVDYTEKEFNDLMFENGYKKLFDFPTLKNLIKSVMNEKN